LFSTHCVIVRVLLELATRRRSREDTSALTGTEKIHSTRHRRGRFDALPPVRDPLWGARALSTHPSISGAGAGGNQMHIMPRPSPATSSLLKGRAPPPGRLRPAPASKDYSTWCVPCVCVRVCARACACSARSPSRRNLLLPIKRRRNTAA